MAWLAQRLPVGTRPEERHIAAVRLDVIDNRGGHQIAAVFVSLAKRMLSQVALASLLPLVAIAALGRCTAPGFNLLSDLAPMRFASIGAIANQGAAAGMTAGLGRRCGHGDDGREFPYRLGPVDASCYVTLGIARVTRPLIPDQLRRLPRRYATIEQPH